MVLTYSPLDKNPKVASPGSLKFLRNQLDASLLFCVTLIKSATRATDIFIQKNPCCCVFLSAMFFLIQSAETNQVLAANLQAAEWLEPHRGKWLVRRDFPDAACSSQVRPIVFFGCIKNPALAKFTFLGQA